MKKIWKRVCTGLLTLTTILTALPTTSVQAAETQYWTESSERVGYIEHVMNDGTIHSTFNEGHMRVEGETAYCVDINTGFKNGYKTRHDASSSMSASQMVPTQGITWLFSCPDIIPNNINLRQERR